MRERTKLTLCLHKRVNKLGATASSAREIAVSSDSAEGRTSANLSGDVLIEGDVLSSRNRYDLDERW